MGGDNPNYPTMATHRGTHRPPANAQTHMGEQSPPIQLIHLLAQWRAWLRVFN